MSLTAIVGDRWHSDYDGEEVEIVHVFEGDAETITFSDGGYTGAWGDVLVSDVEHPSRKRMTQIDTLMRGYVRDMRRYTLSDAYRTQVEHEPER